MNRIEKLSLEGKKALVRVDFNVPLDEHGNVTDDARIRGALPTIEYILEKGGSVILMSHLGRPKNGPEEKFSLKHTLSTLSGLLSRNVKFAGDCIGEEAIKQASSLQPKEVLLLENVRFYKEETKGDRGFASKLASLGDVYVNDAFGTGHRAHASTTIAAEFFQDKAAGFLLAREIDNANKVLHDKQSPFVAIMGGAKVSDKIQIMERLIPIVDTMVIGGGMSYTFIKAQGGMIGNSLVEEDKLELALSILDKAKSLNTKILIPEDSIIADNFAPDANHKVASSKEIPDGWMGLDIGPNALEIYKKEILSSRTILWNGPMGVFEMDAFSKGTFEVGKAVAEATSKGAFSLIGGGDSAAAIKKLNLADQVSYVSTGGGALLEYFEGKTLPGVAAIS